MRMLAAVLLGSVILRVEADIQKQCPSRCSCSLSVTPNIHCWGRYTLPRIIPPEAWSFRCDHCDIGRMSGDVFRNYAGLTQLILGGSSRPVFDETSLEFLRQIPVLEMRGYEVLQSVRLYLIGANHTLVLRITFPTTSTPSVTAYPTTTPVVLIVPGDSVSGRSFLIENDDTTTTVEAAVTSSIPLEITGKLFIRGVTVRNYNDDVISKHPKQIQGSDNSTGYGFPFWVLAIVVLTVALYFLFACV